MLPVTPLHFLLLALAGWVNRRQQTVIDYLVGENRVLREQLDRTRRGAARDPSGNGPSQRAASRCLFAVRSARARDRVGTWVRHPDSAQLASYRGQNHYAISMFDVRSGVQVHLPRNRPVFRGAVRLEVRGLGGFAGLRLAAFAV